MASPINPNQPSPLTKGPLHDTAIDTTGYDTGIGGTGSGQAAQGAGFLDNLYSWYLQATEYYAQVQAGTVVEPDVAGLIEQLNYAYNTLSQAGYGMDMLSGGGASGAGGLPPGAIMGAHENYVYNEFGEKNINYMGNEAVDISDIWVGPGGSLNLNIAATSAEVTMSFVDDKRSNPPKKVLEIKVVDAATGHEHKYYIQDHENINPNNFFINTATGQINDKTGQNLASVGVYDGSSSRAPEYEGAATVSQKGPNHFAYEVNWGDSITFYPKGGVDQVHEVFGPANIYVSPQDEVDVYLRQPSGYEVIVTHADGTHDTFLLQEGYQFDIGAHENQVEWHVPMDSPGFQGPTDLEAAPPQPDPDDGDYADEGNDDGGIAGPGNLTTREASQADARNIGQEAGEPAEASLEDGYDLPEGWDPDAPNDMPEDQGDDPVDNNNNNADNEPAPEPEVPQNTQPEVDPFDPYGGKSRQTTTGSDIPPEFGQDFLFQGATGIPPQGPGSDAPQAEPPPKVKQLAAILGIEPHDIPQVAGGRNFWDKIQAGVLPPDPDVLNIISYFDNLMRPHVESYAENPDVLTIPDIRDRLVGVLQMIYGDDAVQARGQDGELNGMSLYFKSDNGLVQYNINIVERTYYGETYHGISLSAPGPSSGAPDRITGGGQGPQNQGIPDSFRELAMGILFPDDSRNFDQLYENEKKDIEQKAEALMADYKSKTGHNPHNMPSPPDYKSMRWVLENDSSLLSSLTMYANGVALNNQVPNVGLGQMASNQGLIIARLNELFGGGFGTSGDPIVVGKIEYNGQTFNFFQANGYEQDDNVLDAFRWE